MTAFATTAPRFDMGRVVQRTFGVTGRNWQAFGLLTLILAGIPQLALGLVQVPMRTNPTDSLRYFPLLILVGLLAGLGGLVLQAGVIHGTVRDLNGQRVSFGECFGAGVRFFLPVLGLGILMGLGLMVGFILLIVPGVLLYLAWIVATPVLVVEKTRITATFGRSADLTRNHRGSIFGLIVAIWVLSLIVSMVIAMIVAVVSISGAFGLSEAARIAWATPVAAVTAILQSGVALLGAVGVASVYYELRSIKEGIGPEALASVFD
jgi:hypothetical protein